MKPFIICTVIIALYWAAKRLPYNHPVRNTIVAIEQAIRNLFGYRIGLYVPDTIYSMWFWGLALRFNPWPVEIYVNYEGIQITRRKWHGLVVKREFYPINTIALMTITELVGYFAKVTLVVEVNLQIEKVEIERFFHVKEATRFLEQWKLHHATSKH